MNLKIRAKKKVQKVLHLTRSESYLKDHEALEHEGDFLFIHHKASAKKAFTRENLEAITILAIFWGLVFISLKTYFGIGFGVSFVILAMMFYLTTILFKISLAGISIIKGVHNPNTVDLSKLREEYLPMYTVLVPLHKEAKMIPSLISNLERIDYPRDRLDIKLLIESDDHECIEAAKSLNLGSEYDITEIIQAGPRTKPKALNVGLTRAKGKFLTVYDAEDVPDPDQLKKAVWVFAHAHEKTVCVQAKLNFYNPHENMLSRWFTAEYSTWYELVLPGLHALNLPIPLGGTSNHFKVSELKSMGGWDPYNMTEDADLGMRIARYGYRVEMVESTTFQNADEVKYGINVLDSYTMEEANTKLSNWMGQRSRWIKGFMQTFLVQVRHPYQTLKDYSPKDFLTLFFIIAGTPLTHFLNAIFWGMFFLWMFTKARFIESLFPGSLLAMGTFSLIFGNLLFVVLHMAGPLMTKKKGIAKYSFLMPIYWLLMSLASFKAIYQLIVKPHYWEKTDHGDSVSFNNMTPKFTAPMQNIGSIDTRTPLKTTLRSIHSTPEVFRDRCVLLENVKLEMVSAGPDGYSYEIRDGIGKMKGATRFPKPSRLDMLGIVRMTHSGIPYIVF